jgi:hypothetical protein
MGTSSKSNPIKTSITTKIDDYGRAIETVTSFDDKGNPLLNSHGVEEKIDYVYYNNGKHILFKGWVQLDLYSEKLVKGGKMLSRLKYQDEGSKAYEKFVDANHLHIGINNRDNEPHGIKSGEEFYKLKIDNLGHPTSLSINSDYKDERDQHVISFKSGKFFK